MCAAIYHVRSYDHPESEFLCRLLALVPSISLFHPTQRDLCGGKERLKLSGLLTPEASTRGWRSWIRSVAPSFTRMSDAYLFSKRCQSLPKHTVTPV